MTEGSESITLIVGLGNPGRKYEGTRHNLGFAVVDELARRWGLAVDKMKFDGLVGKGTWAGRDVVLLKPQTFMNCSGQSVQAAAAFYKVAEGRILVVLGDLALPVGRVRVRRQGSAGGHNGLDDVLRVVGTTRVARLRIGIGAAPAQMDPADYVLGRFGPDEQDAIDVAIRTAADAVEDWLFGGIDSAMAKYNRKTDE